MVALAVIFLPMLLDGSGHSGPRDVAIELPAEPQPPRNRLEDSPDRADTSAGAEPAPTGAAGSGSEGATTGARAPTGEGATEKATETEASDSGAESDDADSGSGDGVASEPSATTATKEEAQPAADSDGWVVQVGSFTRETNALVLRDRLREADFEAFVQRTDTDGRTLWRVRIGPIATREEANRLSERLSDQRGEPTLVMSHP